MVSAKAVPYGLIELIIEQYVQARANITASYCIQHIFPIHNQGEQLSKQIALD